MPSSRTATGKGKIVFYRKQIIYRDYFDKSCVTNLVTFYNGVIALEGSGRATGAIHLDLCKVFDTVLTTCLSLHKSDTDLMGSVGKELAGWSHPKSCGQCLSVQVSSGVRLGLVLLNVCVSDRDSGII